MPLLEGGGSGGGRTLRGAPLAAPGGGTLRGPIPRVLGRSGGGAAAAAAALARRSVTDGVGRVSGSESAGGSV